MYLLKFHSVFVSFGLDIYMAMRLASIDTRTRAATDRFMMMVPAPDRRPATRTVAATVARCVS